MLIAGDAALAVAPVPARAPRERQQTLALVQVFRGAAALLVLLYHVTMVNHFYFPFLGSAFKWGHSGIDFFFVLSGFIMLYVHYEQAGKASQAGRFLALRAARIFPIYWCVLAVTVLLFWLHGQTPELVWAPAKTLERATLLRAVLLYRQDWDGIVPVAWTLSFELVFYLFFALWFVCAPWLFAALAAVWCAAIVVQWSQIAYLGSYPVVLRPLVLEFFLGCVAAAAVQRFRPRRVSAWWLLPPLVMLAALARAEMVGAVDGYKWYAAPYFLLILAAGAYDRATHRTYPRLFLLLGDASYSIYLVHYGLIIAFAFAVRPYAPTAIRTPNVALALLAMAIVGAGILVHRVVERPLLAYARRRISGPRLVARR